MWFHTVNVQKRSSPHGKLAAVRAGRAVQASFAASRVQLRSLLVLSLKRPKLSVVSAANLWHVHDVHKAMLLIEVRHATMKASVSDCVFDRFVRKPL